MKKQKSAKETLAQFNQFQLEQKRKYQKQIYRGWVGVIIGMILFCIPWMFSFYTHMKQRPAKVAYEKRIDTMKKENELAKAYNKWVIKRQSGQTLLAPDLSPLIGKNQKEPLGTITIPSIHLKEMVIYHGDSNWVLNQGIGNMPWTSLPTGGKNTLASLTGHTGLANAVYFDNIRYLKKGDIVFIHTLGEKKAYALTGEKKVIDPYKKGVDQSFFIEKGKDKIILMTCTPIYQNTHRLLVFAKRVPLKKAKVAPTITRDRFSFYNVWMYIMLLLIVCLLGLLYYQKRRRDKKIIEIEARLKELIQQEEEEK